jgi:putative flippase GtrA
MRYLTVGCTNALVSLAVYAVLLGLVPYLVAAAFGFAAGATNGYVLNRIWTFRAPDSYHSRLRYMLVMLAGLGTNSILVWALVGAGTGRITAFVLTIPPVTLAMYAANHAWTFRQPSPTISDESPTAR